MAKQPGGTHEQHVRAGEQSHKNDPKKSSPQQSAQQNKTGQQGDIHRGGTGSSTEDRNKMNEPGHKPGQK